MKTDVFHLQIIPVKNILPHEEFDNSRALPLVKKLKLEELLVNPILVAALGTDEYLQLDGMNRLSAFRILNLPYILAQIIDYNDQETVELSSWVHFFSGDITQMLDHLKSVQGVSIKEGKIGQVGNRYIPDEGSGRICSILDNTGKVYFVTSDGNILDKISRLNVIVSHYDHKIIRDVLPDSTAKYDMQNLFSGHKDTNIMVVFPTFSRHQIASVVRQKGLFPPGVTRFIIKRRCLNVKAPFSMLNESKSLTEQNKDLEEMLVRRGFRVYEEPTVYFE